MEYIHRLPLILGALAAVISGFAGYMSGIPTQDLYLRMLISMFISFIIGIYIRSTITRIVEEVEEKKAKEEQERLKQEELERIELERLEMEKANAQADENQNDNNSKSTVEYRVGDGYGEDFTPLTVSEIYNSNER